MIDVRIQSGAFDPGKQVKRLSELGKSGVASFVALLETDEDVAEILVDHYPALAKSVLTNIVEEAAARYRLAGTIIVHRHGPIQPGDAALFVGVAAPDREAALEACASIAKEVRKRAPFWRREKLADGTSRWR
jgi:molybdopterin synthase catalytic subunit